jgi:hypothetical protein
LISTIVQLMPPIGIGAKATAPEPVGNASTCGEAPIPTPSRQDNETVEGGGVLNR